MIAPTRGLLTESSDYYIIHWLEQEVLWADLMAKLREGSQAPDPGVGSLGELGY